MKEKVLNVAMFFINAGVREDKPITHLKLQKLLYFAQGWALAAHNKSLFENDFQAWKYGPVQPEIYHTFCEYGGRQIELNFPDIEFSEEESFILELVWRAYGKLSGQELSARTHEKGTPWDLSFRDGERDIVIPKKLIQTHFERKLENGQMTAA